MRRDGKMTEESKGMNPRTWNAIAVGMLLIAIALGVILYFYTGDLLNAFSAILRVFGLYIAATSFARKGGENNFGPSASDAAMAAGGIVAGVGVTGFVYSLSGEVLITAAVLIIIVAVIGIAMALKNRNV